MTLKCFKNSHHTTSVLVITATSLTTHDLAAGCLSVMKGALSLILTPGLFLPPLLTYVNYGRVVKQKHTHTNAVTTVSNLQKATAVQRFLHILTGYRAC